MASKNIPVSEAESPDTNTASSRHSFSNLQRGVNYFLHLSNAPYLVKVEDLIYSSFFGLGSDIVEIIKHLDATVGSVRVEHGEMEQAIKLLVKILSTHSSGDEPIFTYLIDQLEPNSTMRNIVTRSMQIYSRALRKANTQPMSVGDILKDIFASLYNEAENPSDINDVGAEDIRNLTVNNIKSTIERALSVGHDSSHKASSESPDSPDSSDSPQIIQQVKDGHVQELEGATPKQDGDEQEYVSAPETPEGNTAANDANDGVNAAAAAAKAAEVSKIIASIDDDDLMRG